MAEGRRGRGTAGRRLNSRGDLSNCTLHQRLWRVHVALAAHWGIVRVGLQFGYPINFD